MSWMATFGGSASALYSNAAKGLGNKGSHAFFLASLARSEKDLARALLLSVNGVRKSGGRSTASTELHQLKGLVEDSYSFLKASSGMSEDAFMEGLLQCEYLKWNSIIVPLAAMLGAEAPGPAPFLIAAQRHKRRIERYLQDNRSLKPLHFRFKASHPVWVERFLIVGDFAPEVESELGGEGFIEVAPHGKEAMERLRERYYAAVLTDTDAPLIDGIEVCKRASRLYPGIEERFLFMYGSLTRRHRDFIRRKGLRGLKKPSPPGSVISEVVRILDR